MAADGHTDKANVTRTQLNRQLDAKAYERIYVGREDYRLQYIYDTGCVKNPTYVEVML